jgi:hypothetical protein
VNSPTNNDSAMPARETQPQRDPANAGIDCGVDR